MKNIQTTIVILIQILTITASGINSLHATENSKRKPINYNVILDLSDRILIKHQVEKDIAMIEKMFNRFEKTFSHCIIPAISFSTHALSYFYIIRKKVSHFV